MSKKTLPRIIDTCPKHGSVEFVIRSDSGTGRCTKCRSEAVQKRRDKVKRMAVEYKGGKCSTCGYDKCIAAMEFHHPNADKDFGISELGYTRAWEKIRAELDKCVMLCANCHREAHNLP